VLIDNATYYIDAFVGYSRDEAKMVCESVNMTMISFEGDEQKWRAVNTYVSNYGIRFKKYFQPLYSICSPVRIGYEINYFWIDALRDAGSTEWYWETSKNIMTENDFYWGISQPSLPNVTDISSCINFRYASGGYDDDYCDDVPFLDAMCQYSD
jgi:hypothetical protein